jgi:hypothetical protein
MRFSLAKVATAEFGIECYFGFFNSDWRRNPQDPVRAVRRRRRITGRISEGRTPAVSSSAQP